MKFLGSFLLLFSLIIGHSCYAQSEWLGNRISNTAMFMDPVEVQMSGSINGLLQENATESQYLPFGVGIAQSIVQKSLEENKNWEILGEMAVFTQFEWIQVNGEQQRNLLNTDYRITFSYIRTLNSNSTYRIRFFHVSSHLGDDFLIRNGINKFSENKMNYEQLEFTYFRNMAKNIRLYGGLGAVVRPNSKRLPLSYHLGGHKNWKAEGKRWGWSMGYMLKGFQETDFNPNHKIGFGPAFFADSKREPMRIVLEYYTGHLPYSQFEPNRIEWLGLGLYFYLN